MNRIYIIAINNISDHFNNKILHFFIRRIKIFFVAIF